MRKEYITKLSDQKLVYQDIATAFDNSNRATNELINFIKSHHSRIEPSLTNPAIKSGNPKAVYEMIQARKGFEEALEIATKRFTSRIQSEMRKTDRYYVLRIKTATGYIKSEESESKLRAARTLRTKKLQKDAIKSFFENSPSVFATKFAITEKGIFSDGKFALDKFLGNTQTKLYEIAKIYNRMNKDIAQLSKEMNDQTKKAWVMLNSIHPNEYMDFSKSSQDMKNLDTLIRNHFTEILQGLMYVRSNIEASVASANNTMRHIPDFEGGLQFATG